ncbi:MAG: spore germination protein [Moorellales bacterium]
MWGIRHRLRGRSRFRARQEQAPPAGQEDRRLVGNLEVNLRLLRSVFDRCSDIVYREFVLAQQPQARLALVYADGLVDRNAVSEQIQRALELELALALPGPEREWIRRGRVLELVRDRGICTGQIRETDRLTEVVQAVLSGDTVLLADGQARAIINALRGWETRAISESEAEPSVRGSREAFVESLRVNTALLRRKIKHPRLKMETLTLGALTRTEVVVAYVEGIARPELVEEVKRRLEKAKKVDAVLESGYLEELIEDHPYSLFPTVNHTEKPDRVAALLLEGRVAVLTDGTPFVLTVPNLFVEYFQAPEDYYERFVFASAVRLVRLTAALFSLILPSFYIAVVSFHHEMLPTALLLSIAAQREAVPFPVFVEVLVLELAFEILREAGIRLPRPVGQAVSIVGALVIGEAAVRAGLVASATVIVVALTGIGSFTFAYSASIALRLLRFALMAFSASLGLFGLTCGLALIIIHLCSLRSFGVPYLYPLAPTTWADWRDTAFRAPWWAMLTRPRLIAGGDRVRQATGLRPRPPAGRSGK